MAPAPRKLSDEEAKRTQLGDPVSLKAETADSSPTDQDRGAGSQSDKESTKGNDAKHPTPSENPTLLGDPVSMDVEESKDDTKAAKTAKPKL